MAVPAGNISLTRLRSDFDTSGTGELDDEAIRWRTHAYTGSETPISMRALSKSAGCVQPIKFGWGTGGSRNASAKDRANSQYMTSYSVTTTPGVCVVQATHRGQASTTPVACISRHYAYIDGGGQIRVQWNMSAATSGWKVSANVEILASDFGYLNGNNEYLGVFTSNSSENRVFTVPANKPFVSVMLQCNVSGTSNSEGGTINYTNVRLSRA